MRRFGSRPPLSTSSAFPPLGVVLTLLTLAFCALLCQPASARNHWTGPCVAGQKRPVCHFWKAKIVTKSGGKPIAGIADGDTIRVRIYGNRSAAPKSVRFVGINAMELSR
jgi:endonuclease YncB( thermonuclease family)